MLSNLNPLLNHPVVVIILVYYNMVLVNTDNVLYMETFWISKHSKNMQKTGDIFSIYNKLCNKLHN